MKSLRTPPNSTARKSWQDMTFSRCILHVSGSAPPRARSTQPLLTTLRFDITQLSSLPPTSSWKSKETRQTSNLISILRPRVEARASDGGHSPSPAVSLTLTLRRTPRARLRPPVARSRSSPLRLSVGFRRSFRRCRD